MTDRKLYVFTNTPEDLSQKQILKMFYDGLDQESIGLMQAKNVETGDLELVLVGISVDKQDNAHLFPIAKVLKAEDASQFLSPDGKGGYFDPQVPTDDPIE